MIQWLIYTNHLHSLISMHHTDLSRTSSVRSADGGGHHNAHHGRSGEHDEDDYDRAFDRYGDNSRDRYERDGRDQQDYGRRERDHRDARDNRDYQDGRDAHHDRRGDRDQYGREGRGDRDHDRRDARDGRDSHGRDSHGRDGRGRDERHSRDAHGRDSQARDRDTHGRDNRGRDAHKRDNRHAAEDHQERKPDESQTKATKQSPPERKVEVKTPTPPSTLETTPPVEAVEAEAVESSPDESSMYFKTLLLTLSQVSQLALTWVANFNAFSFILENTRFFLANSGIVAQCMLAKLNSGLSLSFHEQ